MSNGEIYHASTHDMEERERALGCDQGMSHAECEVARPSLSLDTHLFVEFPDGHKVMAVSINAPQNTVTEEENHEHEQPISLLPFLAAHNLRNHIQQSLQTRIVYISDDDSMIRVHASATNIRVGSIIQFGLGVLALVAIVLQKTFINVGIVGILMGSLGFYAANRRTNMKLAKAYYYASILLLLILFLTAMILIIVIKTVDCPSRGSGQEDEEERHGLFCSDSSSRLIMLVVSSFIVLPALCYMPCGVAARTHVFNLIDAQSKHGFRVILFV
eukprot:TRINITY_DN4566_c0_g1_i10.p1 TRINITY_DN4566_c0_g1~~TRINITY_DN4566_c0_g1_i10.p1  ORF type:complete len:273 (+),score=45.93 TRINITY_DN4566_c0_g1_i10:54-872(+)